MGARIIWMPLHAGVAATGRTESGAARGTKALDSATHAMRTSFSIAIVPPSVEGQASSAARSGPGSPSGPLRELPATPSRLTYYYYYYSPLKVRGTPTKSHT